VGLYRFLGNRCRHKLLALYSNYSMSLISRARGRALVYVFDKPLGVEKEEKQSQITRKKKFHKI
jgi:hypothetical protein